MHELPPVERFTSPAAIRAYDSSNVGFVLLCHTIRAAFDDAVREYRFGLRGRDRLRTALRQARPPVSGG